MIEAWLAGTVSLISLFSGIAIGGIFLTLRLHEVIGEQAEEIDEQLQAILRLEGKINTMENLINDRARKAEEVEG